MSENSFGAQIVPFHSKPPSLSLMPNPQQEQIHASLSRLLAALEDQKTAVQEWRINLNSLHIAVQKLGTNMGSYSGKLARLEDNLNDLRAKSLETV
ncbi:hypothetical protein, partial [Pseudomonas sp.]|uniref:hypothetical protein n=1 Tax=Pseudomonas sp. TaxID=306 RepID=UPI00263126DC